MRFQAGRFGEGLPDRVKARLIRLVHEKAILMLAGVEGEAGRLVQVEYRPEAVLIAEGKGPVDAPKAVLLRAAVLVLDDIIVHGDAHVVEAEAGNVAKIRFGDEIVQAVFGIVALGQPSAEVHALLEAEFV